MKIRIFKTKMKKIIIALLIYMITFNYIYPCVIFAEDYNIDAEAKAISIIFSNNWLDFCDKYGSVGSCGLGVESKCKIAIERFNGSQPENRIYSKSGVIYIEALSNADITEAFESEFTEPVDLATIIAHHEELDFISITIVERDRIPEEGEEDTRTNEEKIADYVSSQIDGISSGQLDELVKNIDQEIEYYDNGNVKKITDKTESGANKYTAEFDENGEVTEVTLDKTYLEKIGVKGEVISEVIEKQEEDDESDIGGILLKPLFAVVNFILDAITAMLRNFMTGDSTYGFHVMGDNTELEQGINYYVYEYDMDSNHKLTGVEYPTITYSPEEIFSGKIELLSIDFISDENNNTNEGWQNIRTVIAQWYKALRMMAIIGLLSILIYTGIKILISANAKDKAKYKEWIINWFMAVAILFAMHIIMAFIISVTNQISELISNSAKIAIDNNGTESATNLMGLVRFMIQADNFYMKIGYEVLYVMLIVFTFKFTFVYLKRVLNMAFLTLIAPIVAFTYPIDKLNDGQAQGFDMWLKEYIFNALLQPMHYIMYYVLLSSAIEIAAQNPIYGIAVLTFMTEAERLLKKIFGFEKAKGGTVGGMGSAFAAGALASNIAKMAKLPKGNGGKNGGGNGGSDGAGPDPLTEGLKGNLQGMDEFTEEDKLDKDQVAKERSVLDEFEAEGALSDNWTDEDYAAFDELEKEQLEKEEKLRQQQAREAQEKPEADPEPNSGSETNTGAEPAPAPGNEPVPRAETADSGKPIREMSKLKKFGKGAKAVAGNAFRRTIYDYKRSGKYNAKRWARRVGKAALGVGMGITAAAVQAGFSLTDGKYSFGEGIAAFSAGVAGASKIVDGTFNKAESIHNTYSNAVTAGDKQARIERAQKRFGDRDDVIQFNEKNFAGREKEAMQRERDNYLSAGVTDLKEMKSGMKYADSLMKNNPKLSQEKADRRAAATIDFKKQLESQGQLSAVYDKNKKEKYIQAMVDNASAKDKEKVRKQYENAFKSVIAFNKANE